MNQQQILKCFNSGSIEFKENELLSKHTSMKVGGKVSYLVYIDTFEQLTSLMRLCKRVNIKYKYLGNGSNVLFSDSGFEGIVIKLRGTYFKKIEHSVHKLWCGASVTISEMLAFCKEQGVAGLEHFAGIPGTVGGALVTNAGTFQNIAEVVREVEVIDDEGNQRCFSLRMTDFAYRESILKKYSILGCSFETQVSTSENVSQKIAMLTHEKKEKQEYSLPSAGCIFKNPNPKKSAGYLIDELGLKGYTIGNAMISEKHANFIVNKGKAKSDDIYDLITYIQNKVHAHYGINLQLEVELIGFSQKTINDKNQIPEKTKSTL